MYIESIELKNIKNIKDLTLNFKRGKEVRRWTVVIGRNGRGKTALLQAIALSAAGSDYVNSLAGAKAQSLPRRGRGDDEATTIKTTFKFGKTHKNKVDRSYPGTSKQDKPSHLINEINIVGGKSNVTLRSTSDYQPKIKTNTVDPLADARADGLPYWFVVAYGINRQLLVHQDEKALHNLPIKRLSYLMDEAVQLIGINFADIFEKQDKEKVKLFNYLLRQVLVKGQLLPEIEDMTLAGREGVSGTASLMEKDRVKFEGSDTKLPAVWLSQGYQSSISWLADLIGCFIEETGAKKVGDLKPDQLTGLVLIDELDLFLHPTWQIKLIPALKEVFPNLQFVVTTHSPLLLSSLTPDEIVVLEKDDEGFIKERPYDPDPRNMTGSELYKEFFELRSFVQPDVKELLRHYNFLAGDPTRSDEQERELEDITRQLREAHQWEVEPPVPRCAAPSRQRREP